MSTQEISLYLVATPIGNLDDISPRALATLKEVNFILAEDTRHSLDLLRHFGIQKEMIAFHAHSTERDLEKILERIRQGERAACITDAGTPGVSDPGSLVVKKLVDEGYRVSPIPGPSAPVALLSVAGFTETNFQFCGFYPREKKDRQELWERMKSGGIFIFFESPFRILSSLEFLKEMNSQLRVVLGRELTKKFEEVLYGTVEEVFIILDKRDAIKGEFVVALECLNLNQSQQVNSLEIERQLRELVNLGANQKILIQVARNAGLKRSDAYDLSLKLLGKAGPESE